MRFPFAGRAIRSEPDCNPVDHRRRGHRRDGARGRAQRDRFRRLRIYGAEPGGILIHLRRMMLPGRDRCRGEKIMDRGSVYRRCGCRDEATGRLLGACCPGLRSREHGSWYFSAGLPSAAGERHRVQSCAPQRAANHPYPAVRDPDNVHPARQPVLQHGAMKPNRRPAVSDSGLVPHRTHPGPTSPEKSKSKHI